MATVGVGQDLRSALEAMRGHSWRSLESLAAEGEAMRSLQTKEMTITPETPATKATAQADRPGEKTSPMMTCWPTRPLP